MHIKPEDLNRSINFVLGIIRPSHAEKKERCGNSRDLYAAWSQVVKSIFRPNVVRQSKQLKLHSVVIVSQVEFLFRDDANPINPCIGEYDGTKILSPLVVNL